MANTNGLISSKDVCATGAPGSAFFVRKGDPIAVPSPIQVVSADGTDTLTIAESNAGDATISTSGNVNVTGGPLNKYINLTARATKI